MAMASFQVDLSDLSGSETEEEEEDGYQAEDLMTKSIMIKSTFGEKNQQNPANQQNPLETMDMLGEEADGTEQAEEGDEGEEGDAVFHNLTESRLREGSAFLTGFMMIFEF